MAWLRSTYWDRPGRPTLGVLAADCLAAIRPRREAGRMRMPTAPRPGRPTPTGRVDPRLCLPVTVDDCGLLAAQRHSEAIQPPQRLSSVPHGHGSRMPVCCSCLELIDIQVNPSEQFIEIDVLLVDNIR